MIKRYNNSFIHIPRIHRRERNILIRFFPDLIKYKRTHDPIRILEAIFYLLRSGCQWRLLPVCYPHWKSVYNKWRCWNSKGVFNKIHCFLLENARRKFGRNASPTICFIDSASRRSGLSDSVKGVDGFKKIKGIKRHIIVDSQGNLLHAHTTCANINDGKACLDMIAEAKRRYPSLKEMRADKGYRGEDVIRTAREHGMNFVCTKSNAGEAKFMPAQGRCVVERSIPWLDNCRRLVRNYERECVTASYMTVTAEVYRLLRFI